MKLRQEKFCALGYCSPECISLDVLSRNQDCESPVENRYEQGWGVYLLAGQLR